MQSAMRPREPVDLAGHDVLLVDETPASTRKTERFEDPVGQEDRAAGVAARGNDHARPVSRKMKQALKDAESGADREAQEGERFPARR